MQETFEEIVMPDKHGFGSFNKIKVKLVGMTFANLFEARRKIALRIEHDTLPEAKGYWNLDGREHKVYYKKELVLLLHTEDCGLGSAKARAVIQDRGFKLA